MKVLFINSNLYGHINPTFGLAKQMVQDGNRVTYYCSAVFREQVLGTGADLIGFGEKINQFLLDYKPTGQHPFYTLLEYILRYDEAVLTELLPIIKTSTYDLIVCDSMFAAGCFLRRITNTPVVTSHSTFAMSGTPMPPQMLKQGTNIQLDYCYEVLDRICRKYGIENPSVTEVFTGTGERNIVYTSRLFNGDMTMQEPKYLFAGPSINRKQEEGSIDYTKAVGKPILYISLGSMKGDAGIFYKTCIKAFEHSKMYIVMSTGNKYDIEQLGELPENFCVKNFVPQLEVLQHADAFITHAGFNSVNEALFYGVPMLTLPFVNDQKMVAKRVCELNLGIIENRKDLTPDLLRNRVTELMRDDGIKENCNSLSKDMKASVNMEHTVRKLMEYVEEMRAK